VSVAGGDFLESSEPWRGCAPTSWDLAFGLVFFLTITDLYRLIAPWAGLGSLAPLTGIFTLVSVGYALHYWRDTRLPLSRLIGWTTFVLLIPLGSLAYSPAPSFRDMALQVLYFSLLWSGKVFFSRASTGFLRGILLDAALVAGYVGVVLSILDPSLFAGIAETTEDTTNFLGRGFGFYLQPNVCAASLTLLFFLWLFARKPRGLFRITFTLAYLLAILLTGSRGGMVMSVFLVASHVLLAGPSWDMPVLGGRFVRFVVAGGVGIVLVVGAVFDVAPGLVPGGLDETLYRIRSLAEYRDLATGDKSVQGRLQVQQAYFPLIAERPFLGYGLGSSAAMRERRVLERPSHNMFIEYTFMYGLTGIVIWILVIGMTWEDCLALRWTEHHKVHLLLFGVLFCACMVSNTVLSNRVLYCVLGWVLARRYSHPYVPVRMGDPDTRPMQPVGDPASVLQGDCGA